MPNVTYFLPNRLIFHVAGETSPDSIRELIDWANSNAPQGVIVSNPRPLKFPPAPQQAPGIGKAVYHTTNRVQRPLYKPPMEEKQGPFTLISAEVSGLTEPGALLDFVLGLDKKRKTALGNTLQVVSPDWILSSGPSDPGGSGGPGAPPDRYLGPVDNSEHQFLLNTLPPAMRNEAVNGNGGDGVVVVILDTAPIRSLNDIYAKWVTTAAQKHPLLATLLDPINGCLQIEYDPNVDIPLPDVADVDGNRPEYLQSEDHDYLMSDHGLFIAGIIHTLASKAKIHLFQVLNRYGVGDLTGIARGLEKVIASYPAGNLVVNMSLTLQFPLEEAHINTMDPKGRELGMKILSQKRPLFVEWICILINWICRIIELIFHIRLSGCEASWFERQALPLLSICRSVGILGSDIIAAAGNKRRSGKPRPQAEYPAAFPEVLGVGALPKSQNPPSSNTRLAAASYSNFSDQPRGSGIATIGGEPGAGNGLLGIYVGDFPPPKNSDLPPTPSSNGWAWWCGTSFATAVMTGMTANRLSNMPPGSTPRNAINDLLMAQAYLTHENEDILHVMQA